MRNVKIRKILKPSVHYARMAYGHKSPKLETQTFLNKPIDRKMRNKAYGMDFPKMET